MNPPVTAAEHEPLPASGSLAEWPLARLLLGVERQRWSGAIELVRPGVTKRIVFVDGAPILAESNLASESLGVLLMDQGRLSRADHARLSQRVQEDSCKEGAALLDLRLLEPKELFLALKEQLRRRVLECFGWAIGEFRLLPGERVANEAGAFRIDSVRLVHDGLTTGADTDRLLRWLAPSSERRLVPGEPLARLRPRLRPDVAVDDLLGLLDGSRALGDAIARVRDPSALAATFILSTLGALVEPSRENAGTTQQGVTGAAAAGAGASADTPEIEIVIAGDEDDAASLRADVRAGAPAAAPSAESAALRAELERLHGSLATLGPFDLLGVPASADAATIKRAYLQAARRFHPDTLARQGLADLHAIANEVFARIAKAHALLSDPAQRAALERAPDAAAGDEAHRVATAETLYRKGEILVRKGAFTEALRFLEPAVELWPDEAAYRLALGWSLYKQPEANPTAARPHLEAAVAIDPNDAVAQYRLGVVLRALGETEGSAAAFARSKALDAKKRRA